MSTLQVSLPDRLKEIVDMQVASGRFSNESEYLCRLIEDDQRRHSQAEVESLLVSRVTDTRTVEMDAADWKQMRDEFGRRIAEGSGR
jgi:antitoxin ParD1/3/4